MGKVIAAITTSVDGYIVGPQDGEWVVDSLLGRLYEPGEVISFEA